MCSHRVQLCALILRLIAPPVEYAIPRSALDVMWCITINLHPRSRSIPLNILSEHFRPR
jgi:hypothetical protein